MDFITKLPKSRDPVMEITYDAIMVIVDRFTKYLIVVPFKESHTAEQLGHLLLDRLVRDHEGTYHDHYRPRQALHVKLLENDQCSNGNETQDVHGLSPTDGWPNGTSKSGTQNVPTALHQPDPQQLGTTITSGTASD